MKLSYVKVIITTFIIIVIIFGILLINKKIWFVYPNKNIYKIDGLDVSHHQGEIDWDKIDGKYKFVFVKATEGSTFVDKYFYYNVEGIRNSGRIIGAYHYFHFSTNGVEQANNFINTVGNIIDLPPVIDFEFGGNTKDYIEEIMINELQNCINVLEDYYNRKVIIYVTHKSYKLIKKYNISKPIWYRSIIFPVNNGNNQDIIFWQYHNSAKVDGINKIVDLNVFKGDMVELKELMMD